MNAVTMVSARPRMSPLLSVGLILASFPDFDLTSVMESVKLEYPEWSDVELRIVESEYRSYLAQHKENPDDNVRPTKQVDVVWHAHIIHTRKYHADCQDYFGYYLHHTPFPPNSVMDCEVMTPNIQAREAAGLARCCGEGSGGGNCCK